MCRKRVYPGFGTSHGFRHPRGSWPVYPADKGGGTEVPAPPVRWASNPSRGRNRDPAGPVNSPAGEAITETALCFKPRLTTRSRIIFPPFSVKGFGPRSGPVRRVRSDCTEKLEVEPVLFGCRADPEASLPALCASQRATSGPPAARPGSAYQAPLPASRFCPWCG